MTLKDVLFTNLIKNSQVSLASLLIKKIVHNSLKCYSFDFTKFQGHKKVKLCLLLAVTPQTIPLHKIYQNNAYLSVSKSGNSYKIMFSHFSKSSRSLHASKPEITVYTILLLNIQSDAKTRSSSHVLLFPLMGIEPKPCTCEASSGLVNYTSALSFPF